MKTKTGHPIKLQLWLIPCLLWLAGCTFTSPARDTASRPDQWAQPVTLAGVPNLHRVSGQLYRSAQPTPAGFDALQQAGIRRVLDLRLHHRDRAASPALELHNAPLNAGNFEEAGVLAAVHYLAASRAPTLVHCQHGADRTGMVVALYRIACQDWSKEAALAELQEGGYGFHPIFTNIPDFIRQVDVTELRQQVHGVGCPAAAWKKSQNVAH